MLATLTICMVPEHLPVAAQPLRTWQHMLLRLPTSLISPRCPLSIASCLSCCAVSINGELRLPASSSASMRNAASAPSSVLCSVVRDSYSTLAQHRAAPVAERPQRHPLPCESFKMLKYILKEGSE